MTATPAALANSASANFTASSTETGSAFEASVDAGAYSVVTASFTLNNLADGAHSISVRARDAAANIDASPATYSWTIDTLPPNTHIGAAPSVLTRATSASFTFTSEAGARFEVNVGSGYTAATSPYILSGLADGVHSFLVRATDAAGNVDPTPDSIVWLVDTVPPETTISASPPVLSNSFSASFTLASELGASYQMSLDGGPYWPTTNQFFIPAVFDGVHTLNARAVDLAGNADETPASFTWTVDTSLPRASIVFPTAVSYTDAAQLHVRGTASDAHTITGVTINGVAATTSDGFAHWSALVPIDPGNNAITVGTTDNFGNSNANAAAAMVMNRGPVIYELQSIAFDAAHNRVLATDRAHNAVLTMRASDGHVSILSDDSHGSGPSLNGFASLWTDAPNNRVIVTTEPLIAVDLDNGNRAVIPTDPTTPDTSISFGFTCNSPCTRLYGVAMPDPVGHGAAVFSVDLLTGARTPISGGTFNIGSGPVPRNPIGFVLDTSTTPARLLLGDGQLDAIVAIEIANGNRTILSSAAVGTGPNIQTPGGMELDLARNRLLLVDNVDYNSSQLIAVDLTTGNRSVLALTGTLPPQAFTPRIGANSQLFLPTFSPALVSQIDLATNQVSRFSDSSVGSGPRLAGYSALLERTGSDGSVLTSGVGAVLRVDLATGSRSVAAPGNYPNTTARFLPKYLAFDTRPGALPNRLLYSDGAGTQMRLFSADLVSGSHSIQSAANVPYGSSAEFPLDSANSRYLVNFAPGFGQSRIVPMDVATGALAPAIADSTIGTPSFGLLSAMAIDNVPGAASRLLAVDSQTSILYGIDLATGARTLISSDVPNGNGPPLIRADSLSVDHAGRRALAVSAQANALQWVDLVNGNRTLISGPGPRIRDLWPRAAADFGAQVAYVISNGDMLLTVDLVSGERVITSR